GGGMLESGIGRAHNVALATLPNFSLPGDVTASKRYWAEDIIAPEVTVSPQGTIRVPTRPGIGFEPRLELIEKLTVRKERLVGLREDRYLRGARARAPGDRCRHCYSGGGLGGQFHRCKNRASPSAAAGDGFLPRRPGGRGHGSGLFLLPAVKCLCRSSRSSPPRVRPRRLLDFPLPWLLWRDDQPDVLHDWPVFYASQPLRRDCGSRAYLHPPLGGPFAPR